MLAQLNTFARLGLRCSVLAIALITSSGCSRGKTFVPQFPGEEPANAFCEELGQRFLGEYEADWTSEGEKPRLRLAADNTFRFENFTSGVLAAYPFAGTGENRVSGEGVWRVASDDGSFLYYLTIAKVSGKPVNEAAFLFRPGNDLSILTTPDNHKTAQFKRLSRAGGNR